MTREEIIRNLEYTMEKHKNDTVSTFDTNISAMCKDILDYLKQEPCEDAISRAWLKEAIHNFYYGLKHPPTEEDIQAYIDAAPSVPPKQKMGRWIPVSERLPEVKYDSLGNNISDYVLLWVKKGDYETYKIGYFSPPNCFDAITSDGWFISICALKDVIAWMPLPKPYKAESEDTE